MRLFASCCAIAILAAAHPVFADSNPGTVVTGSREAASFATIKPRTPEASRVMAQLKRAQYIDKMNSQVYTSGYSSEAGVYYARKAQAIGSLLERMHANEPVSRAEVEHALDNSEAWRYGAIP
jgi:hypothetical protein